jgi:hypothetical protein
LGVLRICDYRRIAIIERLVESALPTKNILLRADDVQVGKVSSTPLLARDRVRAGGEAPLPSRLPVVAQIAVVGGSCADQCCEQYW